MALLAVGDILPFGIDYLLLDCVAGASASVVRGLGGGYGDILESDVLAFVGVYFLAAARCVVALLASIGIIHAAEGIAYALACTVYKECCPYQRDNDEQYYEYK